MMDRTQWPFTEFNPAVEPVVICLTDWYAKNRGWQVIVHEMVTGRYGYVLVEYVDKQPVERGASGAHDEPWAAISCAIEDMREIEGKRLDQANPIKGVIREGRITRFDFSSHGEAE